VASRELFRIGTEAIRNARTHSSGQLLSIELDYGKNLTLSVRDSGRGFNQTLLTSVKPCHFGIMGMRERASNLGGRLLLKTAEGQGTCLTVVVPGRVIFRMADYSFFNIFRLRWIRKSAETP
jgi:signal transduction histidine kinase